MPLFGGMSDEEKKQIAANMQNLSDQIAKLQQQAQEKDKQISNLQQQTQAASSGAGDAKQQLQALQSQLAVAQADKDATAIMLRDAQKQIAELQAKLAAEPAASSPPSPVGGLAPGSSAWVTREGGLPLRLRAGPGLDQSVLGQLQPGTRMTLLDGPQSADNYAWWHIRADDGREGWVAGNDLRTQPD
jgi:uncharacterized protein YgiM (DUF1202 family)